MRKIVLGFCLLLSAVLSNAVYAGVAVGNPQGSVTLVEFFDYQCSVCKAMAPVVNEVAAKNPELKVIYSDFPFIDSTSTFAARAGLAAVLQGQYKAFHDAVMQATIPLSDAKVIAAAKKLGLNTNELLNNMGSPGVTAQLKEELDAADQFNVRGTPTFVIYPSTGTQKPTILVGRVSADKLQQVISQYVTAVVANPTKK